MKRKAIVAMIVLLTLVIATLLVSKRVEYVNESVKELTAEKALEAEMETTPPDSDSDAFSVGDKIDISGMESNKRTAGEGVSVTFSNPRILDTPEMEGILTDWIPHFGPGGNDYSDPMYLVVDATFFNDGPEPSQILWFKLEAGSWSTIISPNETVLMNVDGLENDFINPKSEKTVTAVYTLWEPTFSEEQWAHVEELDYRLVLLDYPKEVSVRLDL